MLRTHATGALRTSAGFAAGVVLLAASVAAGAANPQRNNVWFSDPHPAPHSAPSAPTGALATYPALTDFLAATGSLDLAFEDFENGFTPPNAIRVCFQAVASTSDDPCFSPGELAPGFGIRSSGGNIWDPVTGVDSDLVVLGAGMRGLPSAAVGANVPDPPWNPTEITFDHPATAVAMDVYDPLQGGAVQVEAYDAADQLIGLFTVTPASTSLPAFAGFTSPVPVKRVAINALTDNGGELVDNLYFGGGAGHLAFDAAVDFDAVDIGGIALQPVTLRNDGALALALGTIASPPEPFSITEDACSGSTLAAGATCSMQLEFAPAWAGEFAASLDLSGDGTERLPLRGQGVRAHVSPMPGAVDFGTVGVGGSPGAATLTLANLTGAVLDVTTVAIPAAPFARTGGSCTPTPFALAPGEECTLELSFEPTGAGRFDAAVTVTGSGAPATTTVNLHGTGG